MITSNDLVDDRVGYLSRLGGREGKASALSSRPPSLEGNQNRFPSTVTLLLPSARSLISWKHFWNFQNMPNYCLETDNFKPRKSLKRFLLYKRYDDHFKGVKAVWVRAVDNSWKSPGSNLVNVQCTVKIVTFIYSNWGLNIFAWMVNIVSCPL